PRWKWLHSPKPPWPLWGWFGEAKPGGFPRLAGFHIGLYFQEVPPVNPSVTATPCQLPFTREPFYVRCRYKKPEGGSLPVLGLCVQGLDSGFVDSAEEQQGQSQAHHLGNQERPPNQVDVSGEAQQIGHRHQHNQLPAQGDDGGIAAVPQALEAGAEGNADGRQ